MNNFLKFENAYKLCFVFSLAAILLVCAPAFEVYAQSNDAVTNTLCRVVNQLTGNIGKSISIIIVISLAFGLFLGKVSWGMAIGVSAAMGALFGAKDLVALIAGDSTAMCK